MALRTVAHVEEEYTAARAAYLKALEAQSYSIGTGGSGSRSASLADVQTLREQMLALEAELTRISAGGLRVRGVTPVG